MDQVYSTSFLTYRKPHSNLGRYDLARRNFFSAKRYGPGVPVFMLFANKDCFFVYYYEFDELLRAGSTLEEVYSGLHRRKWSCFEEERWFSEPHNGEEYDIGHYFPDWQSLSLEGKHGWGLTHSLWDFMPHSEEGRD